MDSRKFCEILQNGSLIANKLDTGAVSSPDDLFVQRICQRLVLSDTLILPDSCSKECWSKSAHALWLKRNRRQI